MLDNKLSRRGFLAGAAGVAAATAMSGYLSFDAWEQAHADSASEGIKAAGHSACNGCFSKCGYTAYVKDGHLNKIVGDKEHPYGAGKLCARGYGYSQIAYSENRLTDPLRRTEDGTFEVISWDEAYKEIGSKVKEILKDKGPMALALVETGVQSTDYYSKRFMSALGSPNQFTHGAACNLARNSALTQVIGTGGFGTDFANAKAVMFIGRSYADGIRPGSIAGMKKGHDNGAYIVMVDPRYNASMAFCDEWVPINPGTDLAFLLAMSHVVVRDGLQNQEFIDNETVGFDTWAESLKAYTPEWAEKITGIPAEDIERLAKMFAELAPAASIESGWRAATGCAYANSGEAARALAAFNGLIGAYNTKGGAILTPGVSFGALEDPRFAAPPKVEAKMLGAEKYPVSLTGMGSNIHLAQEIEKGNVQGVFFCQSNMAAGYSNPAELQKILKSLPLCVVIDVHMSETAQCATHVLPDTSYLERNDLPWNVAGTTPKVTLRSKVLDVIHPNTRPQDVIFSELAEACGVGQYFNFTIDELADAQLKTVGHSLEELREVGTVSFPEKAFSYDAPIKWGTPTGKLQFTSDAVTKVGLTPDVNWIEPMVMPSEGNFRLIGGKQAIHSHGQTTDIPDLIQITKDYDLTRLWMNAAKAAELGIEDGDEVEISNDLATGRVRVKVTERLNPTCVFMPTHYGCSSPELTNGYGVGLNFMDFVPFHLEPYYGSSATQEALVNVKKVGA